MRAARIQNYYNYRYCKRFYHTRQRSLNGASHREEPYISCLRFCVKYSSPDAYGNYVDKPYISCIRFWYTRARSLNGLSRGEKPYMSCVRFWHKVLKPGVSSNYLDKPYMHYIRFWHWAIQPLFTYTVQIILYNRLTVQKVDLFCFPIERAHSNWPGGILDSKTPKSGHRPIRFWQYRPPSICNIWNGTILCLLTLIDR